MHDVSFFGANGNFVIDVPCLCNPCLHRRRLCVRPCRPHGSIIFLEDGLLGMKQTSLSVLDYHLLTMLAVHIATFLSSTYYTTMLDVHIIPFLTVLS